MSFNSRTIHHVIIMSVHSVSFVDFLKLRFILFIFPPPPCFVYETEKFNKYTTRSNIIITHGSFLKIIHCFIFSIDDFPPGRQRYKRTLEPP
jgi:hypothetical protein